MSTNTTAADSLQAYSATRWLTCAPRSPFVTAFDGDRPHGTTVSAFMSLSMEPPMVTIALDQNSELLGDLDGEAVWTGWVASLRISSPAGMTRSSSAPCITSFVRSRLR